ncbi:hypothetical protein GQ600_5805 [Phytophthora cactorum]|nr:hypothetical protein GQ600_5805 [Phytophthora cactorum]
MPRSIWLAFRLTCPSSPLTAASETFRSGMLFNLASKIANRISTLVTLSDTRLSTAKRLVWGQTWQIESRRPSKEQVFEKHLRDRVRLLKKSWCVGKLRSALGSGKEESLYAVNEQSHYETLAGLVRQYVMLEDAFNDDKRIVSTRRRRMKLARLDARQKSCTKPWCDGLFVEQKLKVPSAKTYFNKSPNVKTNNWDDMELRRQQFEQQVQSQVKQHEDRMVLEREMQDRRMQKEQARALDQGQAEERMQRARQEAEERNRQLRRQRWCYPPTLLDAAHEVDMSSSDDAAILKLDDVPVERCLLLRLRLMKRRSLLNDLDAGASLEEE